MRGSITKRGENRYLIRIPLGLDENGKRIIKSRTVHGKKKDAEAIRREMVLRYEGGALLLKDDKTNLTQFLNDWIHVTRQGELSANTVKSYETHIRLYIADTIGRLPLFRVSAADVRDLLAGMSRRGLSKSAIGVVKAILVQAFDSAIEENRLAANPARFTRRGRGKPKKRVSKPVRSLTEAQAGQFVAGLTGYDRALFMTALISGMRPGEYLGLTWACVDWERCILRVEQQAVQVPGQLPEFAPTKTQESFRTIAMPEESMAELKAQRERVLEMKRFAGKDWVEHGLVFPNPEGGFMILQTIRKRFKRILKALGLPDFRLYDLRHTCATLLLLLEENIKVVSERLGHTDIVVTLQKYSHVLPRMQKRAAEKLGEIFYPKPTLEDA